MEELDKLKLTQLPFSIKDGEGNSIGQITVMVGHNFTTASFTMTFQNETKVSNNKEVIKESFDNMQDFFKRELSNCGWSFLFEETVES